MRSPRHQLILLGFLCQGLSWDDYFLPLLYALLWALCLRGPRPRAALGTTAEGVLLLAGCAAAYLFGHLLGRSTHFFIGHGLVLVQAVRLIRPLTHRDKIVSLLIALFHVGVACTFVFDLRFIPVLLLALLLIPKALVELESESFPDLTPAPPNAASGVPQPPRLPALRIPFAFFLLIALVTVGFFLLFPRVLLRTPLTASLSGAANQGTVLDSVLDPARSGLAQSSQVLFHVEGENLGYMRCFFADRLRWSQVVPATSGGVASHSLRTLGSTGPLLASPSAGEERLVSGPGPADRRHFSVLVRQVLWPPFSKCSRGDRGRRDVEYPQQRL